MLNVAVLVSGGGTNLQAIIDSIKSDYLNNVKISLVISSNEKAYALERARDNGIETLILKKKDYNSIEEYDLALVQNLEKRNVDLIVMAGFLVILGRYFTDRFKNRIINVHPSLIPSFCGKGYYGLVPHKEAIEYGVKITGATVHFVEYETDAGPIIMQKVIEINEDDTPQSLQKRVMEEAEWKILCQTIKLFEENRISVEGRKVKINKF